LHWTATVDLVHDARRRRGAEKETRTMDMGLAEKVAIVTGAGSGIGEATARLFAAEGARVIAADLNAETAERTASDLRSRGADALAVQCDISDEASVRALVDAALQAFGTIDILANIAGIPGAGTGVFPNITVENWDRQFSVHTRGTFLCTQEVSRRAMIPRGRGKIVNVGSLVAHGFGDASAYSAAKGAIIAFTKNAARTLGPYGINVNVVSPGTMRTPMSEVRMGLPEFQQRSLEQSMIKRIGTAQDVADAIVFLCSSRADHITAVELHVNAGQVVT
jgi:NAD(P)-dependent dehydrogenase (short-subunit alcohol dehydrogenase family)